jgi:hypothetical protein
MNQTRVTSKGHGTPLVSLTALLVTGCQRAPAFNIDGSFFPGWLLCVVFGILFAVCFRWLLIRIGLEREIRPAILVYPCTALSFALTVWLIFFS